MKASIKLLSTGMPSQGVGRNYSKRNRSRKSANFLLLVERLWQRVLKWLIVPNELHVWQQRDRVGNIQWNAYDPRTQASISLQSEDEMREWIEHHYYTGH